MNYETSTTFLKKFTLMHKRKAIENIHQLQENFHKYKMEVKEKVNFLGWLKIIIKQLKGMNNKKN